MSAKQEKNQKKACPNSLSVSQNFADYLFSFSPLLKIRLLFSLELFLFTQYERGLKYMGFGFTWRPST